MPTGRFQSAPPTGARGDAPPQSFSIEVSCFNPLPRPEPGETLSWVSLFGVDAVSIRSPDRSQGRRRLQAEGEGAAVVSIRSPDRSQGRRQAHRRYGPPAGRFNPLPRPEPGETPVAVTSGIPGSCSSRCASLLSFAFCYLRERLGLAVSYCQITIYKLRESIGKAPSLYLRASYKISGAFKSRGSLSP